MSYFSYISKHNNLKNCATFADKMSFPYSNSIRIYVANKYIGSWLLKL